MMDSPASTWLTLLAVAVAVFAASAVLTGVVLQRLRRAAILDRPGPRSAHAVPTPRGGGIAVLIALFPVWLWGAYDGGVADRLWLALGATVMLAAVSWLDDLHGLHPAPRLAIHAVAVVIGLSTAALAGAPPVFQGLLPPALDVLATGLVWLWFLNLFNFMDGIDAIAGAEAVSVGGGLAVVLLLAWPVGDALPLALLAVALAAAAGGFLLWNRPPAKLFLGDVGSIPLGFLIGWLLIEAARGGAWAAALILPAAFLADATWTLVARTLRGDNPMRAHAEHFYQRAVRVAGRSHGQVVGAMLVANLVLVVLAVAAERQGERLAALVGAALVVVLLARRIMRPVAREPEP